MNKIEEIKTYKINDVEVFSVGEWNGDKYNINDLHEMVNSFNALKIGFRPYLKLGHDDKQKLAKSSGLPAVGWVERLYIKGTKLCADMTHIPEKVFKLIKSKAYRKVSCEIYWNLTVEGNKYSRVLGGIAFLGAENPGVMNLDDILGNYSFNWGNSARDIALFEKQDTFKSYSQELIKLEDKMADEKSEKEIALEAELEAAKKSYEKIDLEKKAESDAKALLEKENEELKAYKLEAEKKELDAIAELEKAKKAQFISELESKKLSTPAMKDLLEEVLSDKKEYCIKEKNYSRQDLITELLTLAGEAAKINFEEKSRADYAGDKEKTDEDMIEKYMKENKCDYVQAYKAVMKEKK
jgi:hypothetical protein